MFTKAELKTIMQLADAKAINSESIIDRQHYDTIKTKAYRAIARPYLQKRRLYHTDQARANAISEIKRLVEVLGHIKSGDLSYTDYRGLIKFLADHKDAIEREMNEETEERK